MNFHTHMRARTNAHTNARTHTHAPASPLMLGLVIFAHGHTNEGEKKSTRELSNICCG